MVGWRKGCSSFLPLQGAALKRQLCGAQPQELGTRRLSKLTRHKED